MNLQWVSEGLFFTLIFCIGFTVSFNVFQTCDNTFDNTTGVCVSLTGAKIKNCPPLKKLLIERNFAALQKAFCEDPETPSEIPWVQLCCPKHAYKEETETDYENHPNYKLLPHSQCGRVGIDSRIIGGTSAAAGDIPWMARVSVKSRRDNDNVRNVCGGTVISSRYILTAAHCFKDKSSKLAFVRVGETNEDVDPECIDYDTFKICMEAEDYETEELIIHPKYDGTTGAQHDIALIRLSQDIKNLSTPFIQPICLPFTKLPSVYTPDDRHLAFVSGWGKLKNSDTEGSEILQKLKVPLKESHECGKVYKNSNITISDLQLCAGGIKGEGSCLGDSGGPLSYLLKERSYQIGVVSFGQARCAVERVPVVYTRVTEYLDWILNNIRP